NACDNTRNATHEHLISGRGQDPLQPIPWPWVRASGSTRVCRSIRCCYSKRKADRKWVIWLDNQLVMANNPAASTERWLKHRVSCNNDLLLQFSCKRRTEQALLHKLFTQF